MSRAIAIADEDVINKIYLLRGRKVMLDRDLADMYGVETRVLNQAVKRNAKRFPSDFMFQMTEREFLNWKSQFVISNNQKMGLRKRPFVFTEQGVAMLSSVLSSEIAIEVNIQIIRIFSRMREILLSHQDLLLKLEYLEKRILIHDEKAGKNEEDIQLIFSALKELLNPPSIPRTQIGFKVDEG
ncbi:MAG: ORF6N domain-containing protein [Bacteroidia bacterium]